MKNRYLIATATVAAIIAGSTPAIFAAEEEPISGDKLVSGEKNEIIRLRTDDESIGIADSILRDTSKDPKREPGPINIQRTDGGLAYMGIPTFFKLPVALTPEDLKAGKVEVAFMGAPMDLVISRRGQSWTPQAMRTSEVYVPWGSVFPKVHQHGGVNPFTELVMVDYGDAPIDPVNIERSINPIRTMVREIASTGAAPFVIGGDHSIMYMDLLGLSDVYGRGKIGVVHIDAHVDAEENGFGHYLTHGSPVRRLIDEGIVDGKNFVQIGLRGSLFSMEQLEWMRENEMPYHFMAEIERDGFEAVMERALKEAKSGGVEKLFISFDIDGMDPGYAPAASSAEPGGLTPREVFPFLRGLAIQNEIVGMDVVEINPFLDGASETLLLANRVIQEVLVGMALRKKGITDPKYLYDGFLNNTNDVTKRK